MMLSGVYAKALRDRWTTPVLAGVGVGLMLLMGMAVYAQIDTGFYYDMPAALLDTMGISRELGGVAGIAYGAMYNFMGALAVGGLAISLGASSIAGEERDRTIGLLLANPRSRRQVLAAKLAAMVTLTVLAGLLLWGSALVVPEVLGVAAGGVQVGALVLHLTAGALFWGALALAVGGVTGNRAAAVAVAGGVMVLSWLATSVLPLVESVADVAQVLPWYWFSGSAPEVNGVHGAHLALLLGGAAALSAVASVGVARRDLRDGGGSTGVLDRLRDDPRTAALLDRVQGSARVTGITAKAISDRQGVLVAVLAVVLYGGLLLTPFYTLLPEGLSDVFADLPEAMVAAIGGVDLSTPTGWVQGEFLGSVFPIAAIALFASVGGRALAGEEVDRTIDLLLANPVPRSRVVAAKAVAMAVYAAMLALATFGGVAIGNLVGGLGISLAGIAAASVLGSLLGLAHGGIALALGAWTGRPSVAVWATAAIGVVGYVVQSFFPLAASFERFAVLSPFHHFLGPDPLVAGMHWGHAGVLLAITAAAVAAAFVGFERRDLRG